MWNDYWKLWKDENDFHAFPDKFRQNDTLWCIIRRQSIAVLLDGQYVLFLKIYSVTSNKTHNEGCQSHLIIKHSYYLAKPNKKSKCSSKYFRETFLLNNIHIRRFRKDLYSVMSQTKRQKFFHFQ